MLVNELLLIGEGYNPEYLTSDSEELDRLRGYVDSHDYPSVLTLASELVARNILDVRVLTYAIYAEISEDVLLGLPHLVESITVIFSAVWEFTGPQEKKNTYAKSGFTWLFKQIVIDLQTAELNGNGVWNNWLDTLKVSDVDDLVAGVGSIRDLMFDRLDNAATSIHEKLTELTKWLAEFSLKLPVPVVPEEESIQDDSPQQEQSTNVSLQNTFLPGVEGSYHLNLLITKLELFQQVLTDGDVLKAAIIVADVNEIMESFDPKLYLPGVFSGYFKAMINSATQIAEIMEMRDTPQWVVLNDLYRVDMAGFREIHVTF
jgi:hypothetical protein